MTKKLTAGLVLAAVLALGLAAAARAAEPKPPSPEVVELSGYLEELEEGYARLSPEKTRYVPSYVEARARLEAAMAHLTLKPKDKNARALVTACRLAKEIALYEFAALANQEQAARVLAQRDQASAELKKTFERINETHTAITDIEREHIARFKADLVRERRRVETVEKEAERMWEQARLRFGELESEMISVRSEAKQTIISMSDILFATGEAELKEALRISLARIAGILTVFGELNVMIEGHTDNRGTLEFNQRLSEKRAMNVMDFLVSQGIDVARLDARGYNFSRPVADNATPEGRKANRRVDLVIYSKNDPKPEVIQVGQ